MCPMFWRDVMTWFVVSAATWRATLQRRLTCLDRGQADNSTLCTFRRLGIELKKKQEHQPILQQIDSTCVLCLRDTLQMTNKQNEPHGSRFGRHIAGRSWSLWKSTGLHREPGGEHDLLTFAVMVPDLRNYGPHNFNAVFIALQIWRLHVQLQQPQSLYMATANCIQADYSSGGLQNHFHCLFLLFLFKLMLICVLLRCQVTWFLSLVSTVNVGKAIDGHSL